MAIASNRTKVKDITSLVDKKYLSVTDKTKDTPANTTPDFKPIATSSKKSVKIGKKNVFSNTTPTTIGNALLGLSIFPENGDPSCDQGASNKPKTQDDRSLNAPNKNSKCPTNSDSIALSSILSYATEGLPEHMVVAVETMLSTQVGKYSKGSSVLGNVDKNAHVLRGISSISKALGDIGSPLKEKAHLKSLLSCVKLSGGNGDESSLIKSVVITGLLAQSLCMSPKKLGVTLKELSANNVNVNGDIVKGLTTAFINDTDKSPAVKVKILAGLNSVIGNLTTSDTVGAHGVSTSFLNSLTTQKPSTVTPDLEYADALAALSLLNPNWNTDSSGSTSMVATKGSDYFTSLSKSFLGSVATSPSNIPVNPAVVVASDPGHVAKLIAAANTSSTSVLDGNTLTTPGYT